MKLSECRKGMIVRCNTNSPEGTSRFGSSVKKGDILTISRVTEVGINFEEVNSLWYPENFDIITRYIVGDIVMFNICDMIFRDSEILYYDLDTRTYVVKYQDENGEKRLMFAKEDQLSLMKDKDELKKGDKFRTIYNEGICEVIYRGVNGKEEVEYYYRNENGDTDLIRVNDVKKVVYKG